jgi:hypothetical protein
MTVWQVIILALEVLLTIWKDRSNPEQAKLRAAALATRELNSDLTSFDTALKDNDADALSQHFEQLRRRVASLPK